MEKKEYFYDAFISYRHTELDIFVAESLHKILERYRVPKRIQESSGKKKISRIFRVFAPGIDQTHCPGRNHT